MIFSKKIIFSIFFVLLTSSLFSLPKDPFCLNLCLGTSAIAYGDEKVKEYKSLIFLDKSTRFVLNSEISVNLFLDEYVAINLGGLVGFDWFKKDTSSMFLLKYDIFSGIRVFPFKKGFNFGIDYICGSYSNYLKLKDTNYENLTSQNIVGLWSNGFRLVTEYKFYTTEQNSGIAIGCYWQNMPRVNGYDNSFSVYGKFTIR